MAYSLNSIDHVRGDIVIKIREWDGIDRPDNTMLEALSPAQARAWAKQLELAANAADEFLDERRCSELNQKRLLLDALRKEIAKLEAELADA